MVFNLLLWFQNDAGGSDFAIKYGISAIWELTNFLYSDIIKLYVANSGLFSPGIRMHSVLDKCQI